MTGHVNLPPGIECLGAFVFGDKPPAPLGKCCACGEADADATAMINRRCLIPGHGWGCMACGAEPDGATVTLCRSCREQGAPIRFACRGYPGTEGRAPIEEFCEPFDHDHDRHPELHPLRN